MLPKVMLSNPRRGNRGDLGFLVLNRPRLSVSLTESVEVCDPAQHRDAGENDRYNLFISVQWLDNAPYEDSEGQKITGHCRPIEPDWNGVISEDYATQNAGSTAAE